MQTLSDAFCQHRIVRSAREATLTKTSLSCAKQTEQFLHRNAQRALSYKTIMYAEEKEECWYAFQVEIGKAADNVWRRIGMHKKRRIGWFVRFVSQFPLPFPFPLAQFSSRIR